jgi:rhodanese-related sulfurtransferase
MSTRAARELVTLGYTDVYNLVGGFTAWVEAGLPLTQ